MKASVEPDQLRMAVFTSLSVYLGLLLLPEPTSKLVAVSMTGVLLAYLGAETSQASWRGIGNSRPMHGGHAVSGS